jgi:D-alanyl-D-alanine carboxypeptidase
MAVILGESSGNERAIRSASLLEYGFQNYDWKQLFNMTTVDNSPMDPAAKGITSVRDTVAAWGCGNHHSHHAGTVSNRRARKARTAAKNAKAAADKAGEARPALKGTDVGSAEPSPR